MNAVARLLATGVICGAVTTACSSGRNPVLVVPPPPPPLFTLGGVLLSAERLEPLGGARVGLHRLGLPSTGTPYREMSTPANGSFQFDALAPGRYLLDSRAIGFKRRRDTLVLAEHPAPSIQIALVEDRMCLDMCPADPRVLAAARAQRDRWICDRESESIAIARRGWIEFFSTRAQEDQVGRLRDSAAVAKGLRRIKDDRVCRHVAQAHGEASSLAFTLFRLDKFWLISQPNFDSPWVLDDAFKGLAYAGFLP